jgi:hypothetical protein
MGYAMVIGTCLVCDKPFSFNPHKVPSMRYKGNREPVCKECMDELIKGEEEAGIVPKRYHPDAYSSIKEEEL